jgi:hypothetical protein
MDRQIEAQSNVGIQNVNRPRNKTLVAWSATASGCKQASRTDHIPKFLLASDEDRGGKKANCDR